MLFPGAVRYCFDYLAEAKAEEVMLSQRFVLAIFQKLITKALQVVNEVLDQSGASDVGKYAKERWCEYKTLTSTSSVSPAPQLIIAPRGSHAISSKKETVENAGASSQIDASTPDIEKAVGVCVYVCGYYVYPVALLGVAAGCMDNVVLYYRQTG
ncbi:hypothetical protein JOQ06_023219 [Pogonophryne albipinna]|uniref:Uncharacterized protein n=1 Tax=Pogonophryne albipinna TaxID=1090488 RepID=A0AAD6BIN7_9TELE|nr:hypothetical protein JOQ06_023219 [Pogonophryne albipinna]